MSKVSAVALYQTARSGSRETSLIGCYSSTEKAIQKAKDLHEFYGDRDEYVYHVRSAEFTLGLPLFRDSLLQHE